MSDPYDRIADLAEQRLELVRLGRWDALVAVGTEADALRAALPDLAPPAARGALDRARAAEAETTRELTLAMAGVQADLRQLRRGRTAVRGYGQVAPSGRDGLAA